MSHAVKEHLAVLIVCALAALALAALGDVSQRWEQLLVYDATHDVVPDWLWDAGIPGNPHTR